MSIKYLLVVLVPLLSCKTIPTKEIWNDKNSVISAFFKNINSGSNLYLEDGITLNVYHKTSFEVKDTVDLNLLNYCFLEYKPEAINLETKLNYSGRVVYSYIHPDSIRRNFYDGGVHITFSPLFKGIKKDCSCFGVEYNYKYEQYYELYLVKENNGTLELILKDSFLTTS